MTTKAEQLAKKVLEDLPFCMLIHDVANELRRLSPMEGLLIDATSKRDKVLAVNKVLVESLSIAKSHMPSKGQYQHIDDEHQKLDEALKLAGDIGRAM